MTMRPFVGVCILPFALLVTAPATAWAETAPLAPPASEDDGLALYLFLGHSGWNDRALEAPLAAMGYSTFSADPGSGGFGLRGWSHGWTGDLEFQIALSDANAVDGRQVSLVAGQFMPHVGRVLAAGRHLRTYAMVGLGYGSSSITPEGGGLPLRATNGLVLPGGKPIGNFALAVQPLLGVDYLVPLGGPKRRGFNGFLFGLRAGYNVQPLVSSWTVTSGSGPAASTTPVALPHLAEDGPFVHLVVGDIAIGR
jgi:hypothetical protein